MKTRTVKALAVFGIAAGVGAVILSAAPASADDFHGRGRVDLHIAKGINIDLNFGARPVVAPCAPVYVEPVHFADRDNCRPVVVEKFRRDEHRDDRRDRRDHDDHHDRR